VNLLLQAGIVIAVAVASAGLLWLARRSPLNAKFAGEMGEHDRAFEFLGVAFAVLLAFVVIEAYDSYNEAKSGAEQEADAVLKLSRTAQAFPPDDIARLGGDLVCYGRAVIEHGWPAMQEGKGSPVVNDWGTRFREGVLDLDLHSVIEREAFRQLLIEQDERIDGRRSRLAEAARAVPPPLWFVLFLGAALTIGWAILAADRRGSFIVQATVVTSVAAMIAAALLLVWFLDHPFSGQTGSVRPIEMEHALKTISEEDAHQSVELTPPCDEAGRPVPA
jgi:hypothetical protein